MLLIVLVKDKTAVETTSTKTKKTRRRLKPRLQKRSPPPRTEEHNIIFTAHSSTRVGGFCLYRRGLNRRVVFFIPRNNNLK